MTDPRNDLTEAIRRDGAFDVIVVGGGINGIGVFRELAVQGLRVLLVERNDFCSGCSAAPSRMIHGGLRYLENGEFLLVRESLFERDALLRNAPHMVRPLPTTVPIGSVFSGLLNSTMNFFGLNGRPRPRGVVPIKLGLALYDVITRKRRLMPRHRIRGRRATLREWPELTGDLRFSATYHDAWISHPERLGIELILDARAASPGSVALNYAELRPDGPGRFVLDDREGGGPLTVTAKALVNATGAWLDDTIASLGGTEGERLVAGTKGSHLILENPALLAALNGYMMFFENTDGRVCIVFPYLGRVLAGATDIRVDRATRVRCEPEERDYILGSLRLIFPGLPLSEDDIVYSYSGIRPLPRSDVDFTGRISRGHFTRRLDGPVPQFCMVGGKWTTFRAFAEQTADEVLRALNHPRQRDTRDMAIGGGKGFDPAQEAALLDRGLSPSRAAHLTGLYGSRAAEVADFCAAGPDAPLAGTDLTAREVLFLIRSEQARRLPDVLQRRQSLAIEGRLTRPLIKAVAAVMAKELGWDAARSAEEIDGFIADLVTYHGVSPDRLKKE